MTTSTATRPRRVTYAAVAIGLALPVTVLTATPLAYTAVPHLRAGTLPDDPYVRNYVQHPTSALLHVVAGAVFIAGAMFQVSAGFRRRHLTLHRRMGRVLLVAGIVASAAALYIGIDHPHGGWSERSATIAFALWLLWCLTSAWVAIRRRDFRRHRRWMIRGFVVALGISTVRLWTVILEPIHEAITGVPKEGNFPLAATFGLSFWLGFLVNAAIAEWWLRGPRSQARSTVS